MMTHSSLASSLLLLVLAACAPDRAQEEPGRLALATDTVVARPVLLRDFSDPASAGDQLLRPMSVRWSAGRLFVSDVGVDRVAVLDSAARVVRWIGTRGRGPGELYGVAHIAVRDDRIFVGEALNGRVSEFTIDGTIREDVHIAICSRRAEHDRARRPERRAIEHALCRAIGRRRQPTSVRCGVPHRRQREPRERWVALPGHDLIASDSATTWVFDQATGVLCRYDDTSLGRPLSRAP